MCVLLIIVLRNEINISRSDLHHKKLENIVIKPPYCKSPPDKKQYCACYTSTYALPAF